MSFSTEAVISDAADRLLTRAGGLLVGVLTLLGVLRTAAMQNIFASALERIQAEINDPERRAQYTADTVDALDELDAALDEVIAELPFAVGLGLVPATLLWFSLSLLALAAILVAIDTFGHERDTLSGLETDRLAWKTLNYLVGLVLASLVVFVGLVFLVVPGFFLLVVLFFFPAAITMDGENCFGAFSSSYSVATENLLGTIVLVFVTIAAFVASSVMTSWLTPVLPTVVGIVLDEAVSAVVTAFTLGLMVRAYVDDTRGPPRPGPHPTGQGPRGPPQGGRPNQPPQERPPQSRGDTHQQSPQGGAHPQHGDSQRANATDTQQSSDSRDGDSRAPHATRDDHAPESSTEASDREE